MSELDLFEKELGEHLQEICAVLDFNALAGIFLASAVYQSGKPIGDITISEMIGFIRKSGQRYNDFHEKIEAEKKNGKSEELHA